MSTTYDAFAAKALAQYELPDSARARLISLSENATFLVEAEGPLGVLRVYRPGYQSLRSKQSELQWIAALRAAGTIHTPGLVANRDCEVLHTVSIDSEERAVAMFDFVLGHELDDDDLASTELVGGIAALLHKQVLDWDRPADFERIVWDLEQILGDNAAWGDWRLGPNLDPVGRNLLEQAESKVRERLASYGHRTDNSGLVHCDLRAANVLRGEDGNLWVIDFDDCGFAWFLWDLCSTTSLIEHTPHVDHVVEAWLKGYRTERELTDEDLGVIPDLVFLRRLHLLAWMGTHAESDLAHSMARSFAADTVTIGRRYLTGSFLNSVDRVTRPTTRVVDR